MFTADWGGGVSKDPYIKFAFKGRQEGRRAEDQLGRQQGRRPTPPRRRSNEAAAPDLSGFRRAALAVVTLAGTPALGAAADKVDPVADAKAFQKFFTDKFPKVKLEDFVNGPYSMNEDLHRQWQEKEQFPPYEFSLEMGKEQFSKPFKNGKTYADCFPNGGIGIRQNYPYFDEKEGKVITLELALNRCREATGEAPYLLREGRNGGVDRLHGLHLARQADGHQDPGRSRALEAYQSRQEYFYTPPRPAQFLLRHLPRAELGRAHPRRNPRSRRSASSTRCRSTARSGAAWALPAGASPPATARSAACRSARRTMNTATSNIICPMSATGCRFPARSAAMRNMMQVRIGSRRCWPRARRRSRAPRTSSRRPTPRRKRPTRRPASLRNQWTTTAATLAAAKKAADGRRIRQGHRVRQGSRGAGQGFDLPGHQREDPLEGHGNTLEHNPVEPESGRSRLNR